MTSTFRNRVFSRHNPWILGAIYVIISLALNQFRGRFRYIGVIAGDGPSYYYYSFDWPEGLLGSFRTFLYPLFIRILKQINFPFDMLPILQCSLYLIAIWLVYVELKKRLPFLILFPYLVTASQGPHIGYFSDMQNEAFSLVFWLLGLYFTLKSNALTGKYSSTLIAGIFFSISILERTAYLGPTLVIILSSTFFRFNSKIYLYCFRNRLIICSTIIVTLFAFILIKQVTINKPSISNYAGGLLVGHAALMDSSRDLAGSIPENTKGQIWVNEARRYLEQPCKDLKEYQISLDKLKESYLLQNHCFLPIMMASWTQAIYDSTGHLPLKSSEPLEKQIQAWKFAWPNNDNYSLSKYYADNWSVEIDAEFMKYSLGVLTDNWQQYLAWLLSGFFYDFIHYLSWPELITKYFSISFVQSMILAIIWSLISTYVLFKRKKIISVTPLSKFSKFLYLILPTIFMSSIYVSILPVLYSVARYVVIWFPLLFLLAPISVHYLFKDFLCFQNHKSNKSML